MEKNHRLFLRNLPPTVTKNDIEEKFKNHGTVTGIDIKDKPNAIDSESKFAFVNIDTTDKKLNTCFQELKNLVINGCQVRMEIAKESFLARLQREREESKAAPTPKPAETRTVIEPLNIAPPKVAPIVKREIVHRPTKKKFEIDYEEVPKPKTEVKLKPIVVKPEKIVQLNAAEQKKKNESDEKRLKSLMEKKMAFRMKGGLIREALNAVDQKPLGKKIIFSDNMDSMEKSSAIRKKQKRLFDDEDDDGDNILDKNEFKIRENMNKKLQALQSNFGNDKRFNLDDRFAEDEDNVETKNVESSSGPQEERDWQLEILQNVLGKPMKISRTDDAFEKRKKGMIRYDPMKSDHLECEVPLQTHNPKKTKKAKKKLADNDVDGEKPPELSKDTFYNVSENLVDTLRQDEQFSLLKTFGAEISNTDDRAEDKMGEERGHSFNFATKDPFKYDSSDNESQHEDKITDVQKSEAKNDWNDSLFFNVNDIRFEDARKFFNKQSSGNAQFSTLRRELKQIVRSKIQNNLRKKVTWKKRKQHKS